jgi:ADP-ribose pyrophosphatase YjhB (NUDIX family)
MPKTCDHTSVGMLVWRDGNLLLIERARFPVGFAVPAGHVDGDQTFEEAVRRELKEEVGLDATDVVLIKEGRKKNPCRREGGAWHYWKIYQVTVSGDISRSSGPFPAGRIPLSRSLGEDPPSVRSAAMIARRSLSPPCRRTAASGESLVERPTGHSFLAILRFRPKIPRDIGVRPTGIGSKPKLIVWAHHIAPENLPDSDDPQRMRVYFQNYFKANASTNRGYKDENSFMSLCSVLENAILLNQKYDGIVTKNPVLEITSGLLEKGADKPKGILFRGMLAK